MEDTPMLIRRAKRSDLGFITSSWLKSNRDAPLAQGIPNTVYFHYHHKILEEVIPRSLVLVACADTEEQEPILGWICAEVMDTALVIHYVYVKYPYRRVGVAKALVEFLQEAEAPPMVVHTHRTHVARKILRNKNWVYNPYLLFTTLPEGWENHGETEGSDADKIRTGSTDAGQDQDPLPSTGRVSARAGRKST